MNILFWNINKRDLKESIYNISKEYEIDIIILAESTLGENELIRHLNKDTVSFFPQHPLSQCEKIQIFSRFHYDFISPVFETNRYSIRRLKLPGKIEILLTAIHFIDKGNHSDESQNEQSSIIINEIKEVERNQDLKSNIFVGDFNMNPFESGLIKANGFHATMSKSIAKSECRIIQDKEYEYLYNPMWSLYGDLYNEPIGTYHYRHAELINYQWNIFDQVLLSPSLVDRFEKDRLKILTNDGESDLVNNNGIPKGGELYSDHLPIIFSINLNI